MIKDEKQQWVLKYIGNYMDLFMDQTKKKLNKRQRFPNQFDHREVISDVIYSVIDKLDNNFQLDRFYNMVQKDTLFLYISGALARNCFSTKAPFLRNYYKRQKELRLNASSLYGQPYLIWTLHNNEEEDEKIKERNELIENTFYLFENNTKAQRLFGGHWKYYQRLFSDYIYDVKASSYTIAHRLGVPPSSVAKHIKYVKDKIKEEMNKNK